MKKAFGLGLALIVCCLAAAQESPQEKKHKARKVAVTNTPVTKTEARATFARAENILRRGLKLPMKAPTSLIPDGATPVSRELVVAEMTRILAVVDPKVTLTPRPVVYESARLKMTGPHRKELESLVRLGMIGPYGPLATGSNKAGLTVPEFGDAVGMFLTRVAEITNLPSSKWTPSLQKD